MFVHLGSGKHANKSMKKSSSSHTNKKLQAKSSHSGTRSTLVLTRWCINHDLHDTQSAPISTKDGPRSCTEHSNTRRARWINKDTLNSNCSPAGCSLSPYRAATCYCTIASAMGVSERRSCLLASQARSSRAAAPPWTTKVSGTSTKVETQRGSGFFKISHVSTKQNISIGFKLSQLASTKATTKWCRKHH